MTEKCPAPARVAGGLLLIILLWVFPIAVATAAVQVLRWLADTLGVEAMLGLLALLVVGVWRAVKS